MYYENLQTSKTAGFISVICINDELFAGLEGSVYWPHVISDAFYDETCDCSIIIVFYIILFISSSRFIFLYYVYNIV